MFKRLVMLVRGLMGNRSMAPSLLRAEQPSPNAKPLRVKSTPVSRQAARRPASQKPKSKASAAPQTKAAVSRKQTPKAAPAKSGAAGKPQAIPASKTRHHAK
jgi:hypothetical protein